MVGAWQTVGEKNTGSELCGCEWYCSLQGSHLPTRESTAGEEAELVAVAKRPSRGSGKEPVWTIKGQQVSRRFWVPGTR